MALVMVVSLLCGGGISAIAEGTVLTEPITEGGTEAETTPQTAAYESETPAAFQEETAGVPVTEPASQESGTEDGTLPSETLTETVGETGTELTENNASPEQVTETSGGTDSEAVSEESSESISEAGSETGSETVTEEETAEQESEPEKVTEAGKPEFTYEETVDGVLVSIYAPEGILPEGTTVTVRPLTADMLQTMEKTINDSLSGAEKEVVQLIGFDITFYDADGNEMHELDGQVSIRYSGMDIVKEAEEARVYHADENGNITNALTEAAAPSGTVGFTSDKFSPVLYALYAADQDGKYHVNFYSQDGQTVLQTVDVIEGETASYTADAGLLEKEGLVFSGWSAEMQGETPVSELEAFDLSQPVSSVLTGEESTLNLYAWYGKKVAVSFVSNGGTAVPTQNLVEGEKAAEPTTTRVGYTFKGWSSDPENYTAFDFDTPINEDIRLYAFWDAQLVPVKLVYMYENADDDGYTPAGASTTVYAPAGSYLSIEKSTITRIGQAHSVRYAETADGELTGYATNDASGNGNASINDVRDTYYQYSSASNKRQVMPDGSTVMLVYYNRARVTLTFTYALSSNGSINIDQYITADNQEKYGVVYETKRSNGYNGFVYSFTAKYGQNIVPVWAQVGWVENDSSGENTFYTWTCPDNHDQTTNMYTLESSLFMKRNGGLSIENGVLVGTGALTAKGDTVRKLWGIYARTTLPGETADFTYRNKNYTIYTDACQMIMTNTGTVGYKALEGCTPIAGQSTLRTTYSNRGEMLINGVTVNSGSLKNKFDSVFPDSINNGDGCQILLYDRSEFTLTLYTQTDDLGIRSASYLYGDWIYNDDKDLLKITKPNMKKEGYRFAGWYTDPDCTAGTEYTPDENSRITGNLDLYAKWEPSQYLAQYYLYTDDATPYAEQGFAEGGKIDDKLVPQAVQSIFKGWYWYQNGKLESFDFTSAVGADHVDENGILKLYAVWEGSTGKVSYVPGMGGDNQTQEVVDEREFEINEASVQMPNYTDVWPSGVPTDGTLKFVGWKAPNGEIYQPGRYVPVTRTYMQFEAQWSADAVTLIYDANGGNGSNVTESWARNSTVTVWDNMDGQTPHFTRTNYELLGWDEDPNAVTPTYELGAGTIVLEKDTTTLYAIWKRCTVNLTIKKSVTGNMGDVSKEFTFSYSYTDGDSTVTDNFTITNGGEYTIQNVPVGVTLKLQEQGDFGYRVTAVYNGQTRYDGAANETEMLFPIVEGADKIEINNHRDAVPDTGVMLDSMPYIIILVLVLAGAILFAVSRRRKYRV